MSRYNYEEVKVLNEIKNEEKPIISDQFIILISFLLVLICFFVTFRGSDFHQLKRNIVTLVIIVALVWLFVFKILQ